MGKETLHEKTKEVGVTGQVDLELVENEQKFVNLYAVLSGTLHFSCASSPTPAVEGDFPDFQTNVCIGALLQAFPSIQSAAYASMDPWYPVPWGAPSFILLSCFKIKFWLKQDVADRMSFYE